MIFAPDPERHVVDNRLFIIGLDELYRSSMKELEATHLLECARTVARALGATAVSAPVEGYYAESIALTEYFQLMRALQLLDEDQGWRVRQLREFSLLYAIATSGCHGQPEPGTLLLPRGVDALGRALYETPPEKWTVTLLVERARAIATTSGDFSLVALAARTGDSVAVAATRESVVLYEHMALLDINRDEYDWQVDAELAAVANQFIEAFNQFGGRPLPYADAASGEAYHEAAKDATLAGRCVALAENPATGSFYHWAIAGESLENFHVEEFWDAQLWTTSRYKSQQIIKGGW